jgi:hypothetical protein
MSDVPSVPDEEEAVQPPPSPKFATLQPSLTQLRTMDELITLQPSLMQLRTLDDLNDLRTLDDLTDLLGPPADLLDWRDLERSNEEEEREAQEAQEDAAKMLESCSAPSTFQEESEETIRLREEVQSLKERIDILHREQALAAHPVFPSMLQPPAPNLRPQTLQRRAHEALQESELQERAERLVHAHAAASAPYRDRLVEQALATNQAWLLSQSPGLQPSQQRMQRNIHDAMHELPGLATHMDDLQLIGQLLNSQQVRLPPDEAMQHGSLQRRGLGRQNKAETAMDMFAEEFKTPIQVGHIQGQPVRIPAEYLAGGAPPRYHRQAPRPMGMQHPGAAMSSDAHLICPQEDPRYRQAMGGDSHRPPMGTPDHAVRSLLMRAMPDHYDD